MNCEYCALIDTENSISPVLLIYPNRIEKNILQIAEMGGAKNLLHPQVKIN